MFKEVSADIAVQSWIMLFYLHCCELGNLGGKFILS